MLPLEVEAHKGQLPSWSDPEFLAPYIDNPHFPLDDRHLGRTHGEHSLSLEATPRVTLWHRSSGSFLSGRAMVNGWTKAISCCSSKDVRSHRRTSTFAATLGILAVPSILHFFWTYYDDLESLAGPQTLRHGFPLRASSSFISLWSGGASLHRDEERLSGLWGRFFACSFSFLPVRLGLTKKTVSQEHFPS